MPAKTAQGRGLTPHCCRKTLATWLYSARLPDGARVSAAVVKAIMRHDQGEAHARYSDLWSAQLEAVSTLPHIFPNQSGNGVDLPAKIDDTPSTRTVAPSAPKPAAESQDGPGKPPRGLSAGLVSEEGPAKRPGGTQKSRGEVEAGTRHYRTANTDDLVKAVRLTAKLLIVTARLLASASEVQRGEGNK